MLHTMPIINAASLRPSGHRRNRHGLMAGCVIAASLLAPTWLAAQTGASSSPSPTAQATTKTKDPFAVMAEPGSRPPVFINGMEVITRQRHQREMTEAMFKKLPQELQTPNVRLALENRQRIVFYEHNPSIGPKDAPITMVELTDLSCLQCRDMLREADRIRALFPDKVRHIHIYLPVDLYNATNPAAFYGRLAQHAGMFWDYRRRLFTVDDVDDRTYATALMEAGVNVRAMRTLIRDNARRFYRELDADAMLAKRLGEVRPPVLFVNGIRIGSSIPVEQMEDLVRFELDVMTPQGHK